MKNVIINKCIEHYIILLTKIDLRIIMKPEKRFFNKGREENGG